MFSAHKKAAPGDYNDLGVLPTSPGGLIGILHYAKSTSSSERWRVYLPCLRHYNKQQVSSYFSNTSTFDQAIALMAYVAVAVNTACPSGQVVVYASLPDLMFYLPWVIGQPLMSNPGLPQQGASPQLYIYMYILVCYLRNSGLRGYYYIQVHGLYLRSKSANPCMIIVFLHNSASYNKLE